MRMDRYYPGNDPNSNAASWNFDPAIEAYGVTSSLFVGQFGSATSGLNGSFNDCCVAGCKISVTDSFTYSAQASMPFIVIVPNAGSYNSYNGTSAINITAAGQTVEAVESECGTFTLTSWNPVVVEALNIPPTFYIVHKSPPGFLSHTGLIQILKIVEYLDGEVYDEFLDTNIPLHGAVLTWPQPVSVSDSFSQSGPINFTYDVWFVMNGELYKANMSSTAYSSSSNYNHTSNGSGFDCFGNPDTNSCTGSSTSSHSISRSEGAIALVNAIQLWDEDSQNWTMAPGWYPSTAVLSDGVDL